MQCLQLFEQVRTCPSGQDADFAFDAAPVNWFASYAYNRWRPSLLLSAWSGLDTILVAEAGSSRALVSQERSQGMPGLGMDGGGIRRMLFRACWMS